MRALTEDDAAALRRVELLRASRPEKEIGVIERGDHPDPPIPAAGDHFAGAQERRVEAVAVADNERHAGSAGGVDHRLAFRQRERHGLLDERVLAALRRRDHVLGVKLVRRRDVQRVDFGIGGQRLYGRVRTPAEVALELAPCLFPRIRRSDQPYSGMRGERRQHERERPAEPGHTQAQLRLGAHGLSSALRASGLIRASALRAHRSTTSSGEWARDTHGITKVRRSLSDSTKSR